MKENNKREKETIRIYLIRLKGSQLLGFFSVYVYKGQGRDSRRFYIFIPGTDLQVASS